MADRPPNRPLPDIRRVDESNWRTYRDTRLAALIDSPRAFWATYQEAAARTDEQWLEFVVNANLWLAVEGERPTGIVGLWHAEHQPEHEVHLVGMWVATAARGRGVADALVATAVEYARGAGWTVVDLDVAVENTRARDFYLRLGFRPTGVTGVMPWDESVVEENLRLEVPR